MANYLSNLQVPHFQPFQFFFFGIFLLFFITILRSKPGIKEVIEAFNAIEQNPLAIIVLVIGCVVLFEGKQFGVSENEAATIIGYAGGLLQNQIKNAMKSHTTDRAGNTTDVSINPDTPAPPTTPLPASDTTEVPKP